MDLFQVQFKWEMNPLYVIYLHGLFFCDQVVNGNILKKKKKK